MASPLGSAPGIMIGVGVGTAAAAALEPLVEPGKQRAWFDHPGRVLDPPIMARLVAQGAVALDTAHDDAKREGYDTDKLDALVYLAQTVPGFGEAVRILRRNPDFADLFEHALVRQGLDPRYFDGVTDLQYERLDPAVIAIAMVRGIMDDLGLLPVAPPVATGTVPAFPRSDLPTLDEAQAGGMDKERLRILAAVAGRPMGPESAASAVFRKIIERVDYDRAISEGDVRNEWADAIFETTRQIPTSHDYVEGHLRGWIGPQAMVDGAARHGMDAEDVDLLFKITGRPLSFHQAYIGVARGGVYDGPTDHIPPYFLAQLRQSNIRPEWYNLAWAQHETFPSYFVLRALLQAGTLTAAEGETYFKGLGWPPDLAEKAAAQYAVTGATGAKVDPRTTLATTQAIAALKKRFILEVTDDQGVRTGLGELGLDAASADAILASWTFERLWTIKPLTPAQIKKAYQRNEKTIDDAIAELVAQHMSVDDARTYLTT